MRKSYKRIIVIFILNFRYKKFIKKPLTQVYQITCVRGKNLVPLQVFNF
jgi:hypothetical protein